MNQYGFGTDKLIYKSIYFRLMSPKAKKYTALYKDKEIRRWRDNVARGSEITADVYFRRLGAFCQYMGVTPAELTGMEPKAIGNLFLDFVSDQEKKGYAGSYIVSTIKAVKSWLAYNDIVVIKKIKVRGSQQTPTLENERVPTQEELRRILSAASLKDKVACILMANSGLRPETLGNYNGTDGLRIRDLPDLEFDNDSKTVSFTNVPTIVYVRSELSKARHKYFTFLSEEGCEYLKTYLEYRMNAGEVLKVDSDLISPKNAKKSFIRTINIGDGIRTAIRTAGFRWRPYVLRAFFDTQLLLAESKGLITPSYRAFFMGHKGNMEARYTTNKGRIPQEMIEDMRSAYKRCQPYLQTIVIGMDEGSVKQAFRKEILSLSGFSEEDIEGLGVEGLSDDELKKLARDKLFGTMMNNGNKQKVIPLKDVEAHLANGWEYVSTLPNGKIIVKLPT